MVESLTKDQLRIERKNHLETLIYDIVSSVQGGIISLERLERLKGIVGDMRLIIERSEEDRKDISPYLELAEKSLAFYEAKIKFYITKK